MSVFVLVHGAWHGGWCWDKVVAQLEAMGHKAVAPDMPGHGNDKTPIESVTLEHLVRRVCDTIDAQDEPVVLVGHSYGGAMITQAAERRADKIKRLAYVTAFLLDDGQALMDLAQEDAGSSLGGQVEFSKDGVIATVNPDALRDCFYGDCSEEDFMFARARLSLEAMAGLLTPMRTTAANFGRVKRTYIECLKDKAISIAMQRRLQAALPCESVVTLDTDHSPFFAAPEALSAALARL
ncbi:MAG TPA: alpha/beta fold hydrolase [Rhizomicrobium sp.]